MRLRIAHVTFGYKPVRGGADAYVSELVRAMAAAGHRQTVFQRATGVNEPDVVEIPTRPGLSPGRQFWLQAAALMGFRQQLSRYDRLIVHYPLYVLPLRGLRGLIGVSHGVTWDCEGAATANRLKRAIARTALRACNEFVSNDTFFLREMGLRAAVGHGAFSQVSTGVWFLPNGVDIGRFCPDGPAAPLPPYSILVPRNLYRNRGIHLAVAAFARLGERAGPHRLVVVGDEGDAGYRQELLAEVANERLDGRVLFHGPERWERMPELYRAATLTLIPSLCGEGTSLAALESVACGTPVLATTAGGLPDLPCLLAPPEPAAFADRLAEALDRLPELAGAQRAAVLAGFSLERWAAAWRRVVEGEGKSG